MALQREPWVSLDDYHKIEDANEIKYEYSDGRIYDMSGGTFVHSQIAVNLTITLGIHLRGTGCRVVNSDMKVLPLGNENPSYYPDITVTCNPEDTQDSVKAIHSPRLVIEVLSPSTASRDRGEKLKAYQACPSIEEYMMVSSHHQEVEVYHREGAMRWMQTRYTSQDTVVLASLGLTMPVTDIYIGTQVLPVASVLDTD